MAPLRDATSCFWKPYNYLVRSVPVRTMTSDKDEVKQQERATIMPRGRKPKPTKPPTRLERAEKLRERIVNLTDELMTEGLGKELQPPKPITLMELPDLDPLIGGYIGKVKEALGTYLQRVSVADNFSQRPPFDHVNDPIYRRLIRDFIQGAAMPESKVAALSRTINDRIKSLEDTDDMQFSIIDGLQRLYCFCIAVLLVLRRGALVRDGVIPVEAWEYFEDSVEGTGDPAEATRKLLNRMVRYEIFYNIDLGGLLHYMVTFNTGQRRMSLQVQLEIMRRPLIEELEKKAKIPIFRDIQKMPGMKRPKDKFAASELVLATQAFITNNAQVTATKEADRFLNEDQGYLDNVGDVNDVVKTLKFLATDIHPKIAKVYLADVSKRYILSGGGTFFLGLVAACGYVRNRNNMKSLEGALEKLSGELDKPVDDPLNLEEYTQALATIRSSRGKAIRRLVDDTFRRFFTGATIELEWMDTASQITGATG